MKSAVVMNHKTNQLASLETKNPMGPDQKTIRALLIEDDPDDVLLLKASLAKAKAVMINLAHVNSLSSGLIQLAEQGYDVVLLDLNLPDSRGLETLTTIIKKFPKIPIVVLSGLADDFTTLEAVKSGAQDYLVKGEISGPMLARVLRYAIERKQAEAVLRASEAKYRTLVETTPNGIMVTNLEGKLVLCNQQAARLHSYENPEAMLGIQVFELISPDDRPLAVLNIQKTLDEGRVTNTEYALLRKDGSHFPAELSTAVLRDAIGVPIGFISITRDITERMRAKEAEKCLIALKEEFIASVSHDLRTPLFSLMGYLDLLRNGKVKDSDVQNEFLIRASQDANRLADMVNELLDFSLLESDRLVLNWEEVDLGAVILDVRQSFRVQAGARRITMTPAPLDPSLIADVDPSRIRRVLVNLVENAIKFSVVGGEVLVTGKSMNGNVIIDVIDQGCGIPADECSRVFEKYYQVSHPLKKNTSGIGLGLYISKQIVEAHGGSIGVKSKLGAGSIFTITIPVKKSM
jgi:PAS domain S-box-containing protein